MEKKKLYQVLAVVLMCILLYAFSSQDNSEDKAIVEIPITLENWDDYFELKSEIEVINEERRIKEASISYKVALKDQYLDRAADKESEIVFEAELVRAERAITFVEGKPEIELGEIYRTKSYIEESNILNVVWEDFKPVYEGGGWHFGVQTKDADGNLTTIEEFKMLAIEGNLYLYRGW